MNTDYMIGYKGYVTSSEMKKDLAWLGEEQAEKLVQEFEDYVSEQFHVTLLTLEMKSYDVPLTGLDLLRNVDAEFKVWFNDDGLTEVDISRRTYEAWQSERRLDDLKNTVDFLMKNGL
jgi:hypothetical protein